MSVVLLPGLAPDEARAGCSGWPVTCSNDWGGGGGGDRGWTEFDRRLDEFFNGHERKVKRATAVMRNGDEALNRKDYAAALDYFERTRAILPGEYVDERIAWARAGLAAEQGHALEQQRNWQAALASYDDAMRACGKWCNADFRAYLASGIALARVNGTWQEGYDAWERGDAAWRNKDWSGAVREYREAVRYYESAHNARPEDRALSENLAGAKQRLASAKEALGYANSKTAIQGAGAELAQSLRSNDADATPVTFQAGNTFFGTAASTVTVGFAQREDVIVSADTSSAADSASKTGKRAVAARSAEDAAEKLRCQMDSLGCDTGATVAVAVGAKPSTRAAVFPALRDSEWGTLKGTREGRDLIRRADALLAQQAGLQRTIDGIRNSPDAKKRQQEFVKADSELQALNQKIDGLQNDARQIIDVVILRK